MRRDPEYGSVRCVFREIQLRPLGGILLQRPGSFCSGASTARPSCRQNVSEEKRRGGRSTAERLVPRFTLRLPGQLTWSPRSWAHCSPHTGSGQPPPPLRSSSIIVHLALSIHSRLVWLDLAPSPAPHRPGPRRGAVFCDRSSGTIPASFSTGQVNAALSSPEAGFLLLRQGHSAQGTWFQKSSLPAGSKLKI